MALRDSHTFILFWLRNISVIVKTYELSFSVFICALHQEISKFFSVRDSFFHSYFCVIRTLVLFLPTWSLKQIVYLRIPTSQ